ncbi:glycosyl hydrolase [Penicillium brasilianum]|uniref:Glycosyl hydrolase n=1 Tax=Penicillium brasilianum TaxID=104259 RepID=A0A1S9RAC7_PENBI|nr:glycosyl hydrolase [Penicillium brasilianum]
MPFSGRSAFALLPLLCTHVIADDALARARTALDALQTWYDPSTGLWTTRQWWNSASAMTTVANLATVDPSVMETALYVFNTTFNLAPASNPHPGPEVKTVFQRRDLFSRAGNSGNASQWLDSAYDDDGWWALAWIAAYDVTGNDDYLEVAEGIFAALTAAWGTKCGDGGLPWNPTSTYVNAITNELFLSVAAHLANRVPSKREEYIDWAQREWDWFSAQGFMGENHTINDGLLDICQNNGQTVWSYNQGVVLGGLVELNKAAPNDTLLASADTIAQAAIKTLADSNMVIHEPCEPNSCAPDATQFKGIFIRNLHMLQSVSPNIIYKQVIDSCARSIWANDRNSQNQLGVVWAGPFQDPVDMSTHSSAMDALVAAIGG